ncbi:MAG: hypothetical protein OXF08_10585 [Bacteroidetes bacterium]|nr:hypothetical protein [Bacteroidota bacterium]
MILFTVGVLSLIGYMCFAHIYIFKHRERRILALHASLKRRMDLIKRECKDDIYRLKGAFEAKMLLMEARINHIEDNVDSVTNRFGIQMHDEFRPKLKFDQRLLRMQGLLHTQPNKSEPVNEITGASSTLDKSIQEGFFLTISATDPPKVHVSGTNNLNEVEPVSGHLTSSSFKIRYTLPDQFSAQNWLITHRQSVHETHNHRIDGLDFDTEVLK